MTHYDYDKFVHPVPAGYSIPKDTKVRVVNLEPYRVEKFYTTRYAFPVHASPGLTFYLDYDITRPELPEEINSVIYNVRVGVTVFPVAVYQGSRIWSAFTDNGERTSIYTPEIESFDTTPPKEESSDEYHTMDELYEYRMLYNALAANAMPDRAVKSWRHSDGEQCFGGGWFVVYIDLPTGQVSNHYKAEHWGLFQVPEADLAPEWDGHTPAVAADRLRQALAQDEAEQRDEHEWPEGFNGYTEHHGWGLLSSEEKQEVIERWFEKQKLSEAEVLAIATQASKRWAHTLDLLKQAEDEERAAKHEHAREAEPDPLDEDDHRDRIDRLGARLTRREFGTWCTSGCPCESGLTLAEMQDACGPLAFAPEPPPDAARDDLSASEGESGSVEGEGEGAAMPYTRRLASCVERWPACASGEYNPACCRFPKNCSPHGSNPDDELEPQPAGTYEPTTTIYCHEQDCEATFAAPTHEVGALLDAHRKAVHASDPQAEDGDAADDASEALLCPECDDHINTHNMNGCRFVLCDCPRTPEDVARALTVKAERRRG